MARISLLLLTKYDDKGASSRMRTFQFIPYFSEICDRVEIQSLISNDVLQAKYEGRGYGVVVFAKLFLSRLGALITRKSFDFIWIEKELFPWVPYIFEHIILNKTSYILDYDDAVFHQYDSHANPVVRLMLGKKLGKLMKNSRLVVCGNVYLERKALEFGARNVIVLPTVIDLIRYEVGENVRLRHNSCIRIVWIGTPMTTHYLGTLSDVFVSLSKLYSIELIIIGGDDRFHLPGVCYKVIPWSETTEAKYLVGSDIGIMPLKNTPWELGKCGYKLVQYMACGLPVVASDIGANRSIVASGVSGFLVNTSEEWFAVLERLIMSPELRSRLGKSGRKIVESEYSLQVVGPKLIETIEALH